MKTENRNPLFKILIVLLVFMMATPARCTLTGEISPGYQFSPNERATSTTLNLLGRPSIVISGTVDGTTGLSAGSVNGSHMAASFPGTNLVYDTTTSPQSLVIKNAGVGLAQLSSAVAGTGLTGGSGVALSVSNCPPSRFLLTTNTIVGGGAGNYLATSSGFIITGGTLSLSNFASFEYSLANGVVANTNHNLGATPSIFRWVLVCKTTDLGFAVGDEVPITDFYNTDNFRQQLTGGANATNVFLVIADKDLISVRRKTDGTDGNITASRWRGKCYARP